MNFTQLKYFETVCSCGSVSKAAEVLHISQPSLSMAIRELEAEFGVFLFKRHHKGVSLTPEGETLLTLGKDILTRVEATTDIMKDLGSGRKILKTSISLCFDFPRLVFLFPNSSHLASSLLKI